MINSLHIKNFILTDNLKVNFANGFNVITGETGTGKSVIIGAINLLFEKKVSKNLLFDKEKNAYIEATFTDVDNTFLEKYDIEPEDGELFIAKEIFPTGKSKSFINGRRISKDIMTDFKDFLLDFHNQNKQNLYIESSYQLKLLDSAAQNEKLLKEYQHLNNEVMSLAKHLEELLKNEKEQKDKIELYRYQIKEFQNADLQLGEDENLEKELNKLTYADDILKVFSEIKNEFYESDFSIYDKISQKLNELSEYKEYDETISESVEYLNSILESMDMLVSNSRRIDDIIYVDRERLDEVKDRLDIINTLKQKYSMEIDDLLVYRDKIQKEIETFGSNNEAIKITKEKLRNKVNNLITFAEKLSDKRKKYARMFEKEIEDNLKKLSINDVVFKIKVDRKPMSKVLLDDFIIPDAWGLDKVTFLFSANKGKSPEDIKIAASGGELSRIVLTIKKLLAEKLESKIMIFDEIDTGIGGKTAEITGKFIFDISKKNQVICITHLAQIASYGENHYKIDKYSDNKKTKIEIKKLDKKTRIIEVARMLSGKISENSINHAMEIMTKE